MRPLSFSNFVFLYLKDPDESVFESAADGAVEPRVEKRREGPKAKVAAPPAGSVQMDAAVGLNSLSVAHTTRAQVQLPFPLFTNPMKPTLPVLDSPPSRRSKSPDRQRAAASLPAEAAVPPPIRAEGVAAPALSDDEVVEVPHPAPAPARVTARSKATRMLPQKRKAGEGEAEGERRREGEREGEGEGEEPLSPARWNSIVLRDDFVVVDHSIYTRPPAPWDHYPAEFMTGGQQVGWCELKDRALVKLLMQHGRDYEAVREALYRATGYRFHIDHISSRVIKLLSGWEQAGVLLPPAMTRDGLVEYTLRGVKKTRWAKERAEQAREAVTKAVEPPASILSPPLPDPQVQLTFHFHDVHCGGSASLPALIAAHLSAFPTLPLVQSFYNAFASETLFPPYAAAFEFASLADTPRLFEHGPLVPVMDLEDRRNAASCSRFPFHPSLVRMIDETGGAVTIAGLRRSGKVEVKEIQLVREALEHLEEEQKEREKERGEEEKEEAMVEDGQKQPMAEEKKRTAKKVAEALLRTYEHEQEQLRDTADTDDQDEEAEEEDEDWKGSRPASSTSRGGAAPSKESPKAETLHCKHSCPHADHPSCHEKMTRTALWFHAGDSTLHPNCREGCASYGSWKQGLLKNTRVGRYACSHSCNGGQPCPNRMSLKTSQGRHNRNAKIHPHCTQQCPGYTVRRRRTKTQPEEVDEDEEEEDMKDVEDDEAEDEVLNVSPLVGDEEDDEEEEEDEECVTRRTKPAKAQLRSSPRAAATGRLKKASTASDDEGDSTASTRAFACLHRCGDGRVCGADFKNNRNRWRHCRTSSLHPHCSPACPWNALLHGATVWQVRRALGDAERQDVDDDAVGEEEEEEEEEEAPVELPSRNHQSERRMTSSDSDANESPQQHKEAAKAVVDPPAAPPITAAASQPPAPLAASPVAAAAPEVKKALPRISFRPRPQPPTANASPAPVNGAPPVPTTQGQPTRLAFHEPLPPSATASVESLPVVKDEERRETVKEESPRTDSGASRPSPAEPRREWQRPLAERPAWDGARDRRSPPRYSPPRRFRDDSPHYRPSSPPRSRLSVSPPRPSREPHWRRPSPPPFYPDDRRERRSFSPSDRERGDGRSYESDRRRSDGPPRHFSPPPSSHPPAYGWGAPPPPQSRDVRDGYGDREWDRRREEREESVDRYHRAQHSESMAREEEERRRREGELRRQAEREREMEEERRREERRRLERVTMEGERRARERQEERMEEERRAYLYHQRQQPQPPPPPPPPPSYRPMSPTYGGSSWTPPWPDHPRRY